MDRIVSTRLRPTDTISKGIETTATAGSYKTTDTGSDGGYFVSRYRTESKSCRLARVNNRGRRNTMAKLLYNTT
jgi:hypothetical protein